MQIACADAIRILPLIISTCLQICTSTVYPWLSSTSML